MKGTPGCALLWAAAIGIFVLILVLARLANLEKGPVFQYAKALEYYGGFPLWNVVGAFVIGVFGSWAFVVAVGGGFVDHRSKVAIQAMSSSPGVISLYLFLGGIISGVFQLGSPNAFAPIQALVLGVTWPSVISQYLAGQNKLDVQDAYKTLEKKSDGSQKPAGEILG
jgi:hypothetical protein